MQGRFDGSGRVIVLGAGAIGAAVGALLHEQGARVTLVARGEHGAAMAARGVGLRLPGTSRTVVVPTVGEVTTLAPGEGDLLVLATMGHDTEQALWGVAPEVQVVSLQNGVLPIEVARSRGHRVAVGVVYLPAERRGPGVIALPGSPVIGAVLLGRYPTGDDGACRWLVERLAAAGLRADVEADIMPWVWAKLLINLGGIVVALCDEPPIDVIEAVQAEARRALVAGGERFVEPSALLARVGPLSTLPVDGEERRGGSTRSALSRGDRLETEALHRSIIERGSRHGVGVPVNRALVELAERATRERWAPGRLSADELRVACGLAAR